MLLSRAHNIPPLSFDEKRLFRTTLAVVLNNVTIDQLQLSKVTMTQYIENGINHRWSYHTSVPYQGNECLITC